MIIADSQISRSRRCSALLSDVHAHGPVLRQRSGLDLRLRGLLVICTIVDLHDVASVLLLVLRYLILRFLIVALGACRLAGGNSSFHHGVDLFEREVRIGIYLPEPVELPIVDEQNEIEVALVRYLYGLLDQVFRAPVFRVCQVCCVVVIRRLLWLVCAH